MRKYATTVGAKHDQRCPFCAGKFFYSDEPGAEGVGHSLPMCTPFKSFEPSEFVRKARIEIEKQLRPLICQVFGGAWCGTHCKTVAPEGSAAWGGPCILPVDHQGAHVYGEPPCWLAAP